MNTDLMNSTRTAQASVLSTNRVIRNTYILLSMTLLTVIVARVTGTPLPVTRMFVSTGHMFDNNTSWQV